MPDPAVRDAAFADVGLEFAATRRVLERVPDEHLGWRPHDKSWTLGELATHIAGLPRFPTTTLREDELDLAALPPPEKALPSREAILETWDRHAATFREALADATDEHLAAPWTLRAGPRELSTDPRGLVVRRWGLSHIAHHRGQLTVYLRLLDVPVPSVYGPTADEQPSFG